MTTGDTDFLPGLSGEARARQEAPTLLVEAVRTGDAVTVQRILSRGDLPRIAVQLAEWLSGTRPLRPCGTRGAAERHIANGEPLDAACEEARRTYYRERARSTRSRRVPVPTVDEIAVERAMRGEDVPLTKAERADALHRLIAAGVTKSAAGERLRLSGESVNRLLAQANVDAVITPADPVKVAS